MIIKTCQKNGLYTGEQEQAYGSSKLRSFELLSNFTLRKKTKLVYYPRQSFVKHNNDIMEFYHLIYTCSSEYQIKCRK